RGPRPLSRQTDDGGYGRPGERHERIRAGHRSHPAFSSGGSNKRDGKKNRAVVEAQFTANVLRERHAVPLQFSNRGKMAAKILIIEDESGLVTTLRDRLRKQGYVVSAARDGETGLEMAARAPVNLILLDL